MLKILIRKKTESKFLEKTLIDNTQWLIIKKIEIIITNIIKICLNNNTKLNTKLKSKI